MTSQEAAEHLAVLCRSATACFDNDDGELLVGGTRVSELMSRTSGQAFYAYDGALITQRVAALKDLLPASVKLHYAMKANPMPQLVSHLSTITDGLDVASARELSLALETGIAPEEVSFAGPGKSELDLEAAVAAGVIIVIESGNEAHRVANLAHKHGVKPRCAIRINPDFQLKSSGMKMGGGSQPFGIDAEVVPQLLESLNKLPLDILGFHIYAGSQNLQAETIVSAQEQTLQLVDQLAPLLPDGLRWLNMGGGFGVPYFPGEKHLDVYEVTRSMNGLLEERRELLAATEVVIELGRYIVAEAGIYVCKISDKKDSRGKTFLVTNGGLHHHLAVTGNFGQVIRRNYPVVIANKMVETELETVSVVGPLCTPLDILGQDVELPKADIGDYVGILVSGAYGFSASPHHFLSHPPPQEFFII